MAKPLLVMAGLAPLLSGLFHFTDSRPNLDVTPESALALIRQLYLEGCSGSPKRYLSGPPSFAVRGRLRKDIFLKPERFGRGKGRRS